MLFDWLSLKLWTIGDAAVRRSWLGIASHTPVEGVPGGFGVLPWL
jgi:hypothetical protein